MATLTDALREDIDFRIITTDRDFQSTHSYNEVPADTWTVYQGRTVFYISPENLHPEFILQLILNTPHDGIYLNSLFSRLFTLHPLRWKKQGKLRSFVILAPRGMLGDGALAIKPLKKKLFLLSARCYGLFKGITWQSTSAQETAEIRKRIGKDTSITEVSNLPKTAHPASPLAKQPGELRLCFISRICEKKNLAFAIDVLKNVTGISLVFDVYGPVEDEAYWEQCRLLAVSLPEQVSFSYRGSLRPEAIGAALSGYHALFLPTRNENYGHIIVEALQHGRPVILSDQTPWRNLRAAGVGYDESLSDQAAFADAIGSLAAMDQHAYETICKACVSYIRNALNLESIRTGYQQLFRV